jgi:hypothetical protein
MSELSYLITEKTIEDGSEDRRQIDMSTCHYTPVACRTSEEIEEIILQTPPPPKSIIYNDDTKELLFWDGYNLYKINMQMP